MEAAQVRAAVGDMPALLRAVVVERFATSDLAYHNATHIAHMLDGLERWFAAELAPRDARILRYAIWLHDLFYDVEAPDNERRSADIGLALLRWPDDERRELEACIMATKGHAPEDGLPALMVDLDLAILSEERERYRRYALAIRDEYRRFPDAAYRAGRIRVLTALKEAPLLARLSQAMGLSETALEDRARANMAWEIERLSSGAATVEIALEQ
jgi:predicted metal-dependent HD superfamily phosphohydrolase